MNNPTTLSIALLLSICLTAPSMAQDEPSIADRVAIAIKDKDPEWHYIPGICTCPPLTPGQRKVVVGEWSRKTRRGGRQSVNVQIYEIATSEEAAKWMMQYGRGEVAEGWTPKKFDLSEANEAYTLGFRNGQRFSIYFRKGSIIVSISGESRSTVEEFARFVIRQIPGS